VQRAVEKAVGAKTIAAVAEYAKALIEQDGIMQEVRAVGVVVRWYSRTLATG
jgi:hypothetical protein